MSSPVATALPVEFVVPGIAVSAQGRTSNRDQWKALVSAAAAAAWTGPVVTSELQVTVTQFARGGWRLDLDNMAKLTLDAISGVVWKDDKQIVDLHLARRDADSGLRLFGASPVILDAFKLAQPFVYIAVTNPQDLSVVP